MSHKLHQVCLPPSEEVALRHFITTGTHKAQEITRARVLLLAHEDTSDPVIARMTGCSVSLAYHIRRRFAERGSWQTAIADAPRSGQPPKLTQQHKAFVTATACTDPPPGHAHWTIPALKQSLLETYTDIRSISDEAIRKVLLQAELKPWREKNVVHPETHARV